MARVGHNVITEGLRGKVGNLVFRRRGNKTTVYILAERKAPLTENQKGAQKRFSKAVALAKAAMKNDSELKHFIELARENGKESAYSAAVSFFMNSLKDVK